METNNDSETLLKGASEYIENVERNKKLQRENIVDLLSRFNDLTTHFVIRCADGREYRIIADACENGVNIWLSEISLCHRLSMNHFSYFVCYDGGFQVSERDYSYIQINRDFSTCDEVINFIGGEIMKFSGQNKVGDCFIGN